jgi:hypothetical protein
MVQAGGCLKRELDRAMYTTRPFRKLAGVRHERLPGRADG